MSASPPTWKTGDNFPPYTAFLQQAGGASTLPLTTASSVLFIAKNSGSKATSVIIRGNMVIASPAIGYLQYNWGGSDLIFADTYNVEYEITWAGGGSPPPTETVPNDSYDTFTVVADLEGDPFDTGPFI